MAQPQPQPVGVAAAPAVVGPSSYSNNNNNHHAPSPKSPQSPGGGGSQSYQREQTRIALLFDINVDLIQEVQRLQAQGQGGAVSPQQQQQLRNEGKPDRMAADEYIQCLRRVQANLAYLMPKASNDPTKTPPGPAHMTPPPHMPQMQPVYDRLRDLFPGWQGLDHRMAAAASTSSSASPRNSNGPNLPK